MSVQAAFSDGAPRLSNTTARAPVVGLRWRTILFLQTGLAVVTALITIGRKSLWGDEGFSFAAAHLPLFPLGRLVALHESNMGPYYVLLHFWLYFGRSEGTLRLLSVMFAVATVPVLSTVLDRTCGRRAATIAGFLLALNVMFVSYAQELRAYSMVMFGVTASMALFVELVLRPRRWIAYAYVAVTGLSIYAHYFGGMVFVAQVASLLLLPDARVVLRRLRWPLLSVVAIAAPLVPFILVQGNDRIDWIPPLSLNSVKVVLWNYTSDYDQRVLVAALWLLCVVLAARATYRRLRAAGRSERAWLASLLWLWLLVPLALTALASVEVSLCTPRYLIVSLPAFIGVASLGIAQVPSRVAVLGLVALLLAGSMPSLRGYYEGRDKWGEDWRSASAFLAAPGQARLPVLFAPATSRDVVGYYSWSRTTRPPDDVLLPAGADAYQRIRAATASPETVLGRLENTSSPILLVEDGELSPATLACLSDAGATVSSAGYSFGNIKIVVLEHGPRGRRPTTPVAESC